MERQSTTLQLSLNVLTDKFSILSQKLTQYNAALQISLIPPSAELVEQIVDCRQEFKKLSSEVLKLAESLGISTPCTDEVISVKNIKTLLETVVETEKITNYANIRQQAIQVLNKILLIRYTDNIDFIPLQQCQLRASELYNAILNFQDIHSEAEALALDEHPLTKLLTLISQRESPNFKLLEELQTAVADLFGMPLALAALTGKLVLLEPEPVSDQTEVDSTNEVTIVSENAEQEIPTITLVEEPTCITEAQDTARIESSFDKNDLEESEEVTSQIQAAHTIIPLTNILIDEKTGTQETALSLLNSHTEESYDGLEYLIWQLIYEDKLSLAFHLARYFEIKYANVQPQLNSWIIRATILGQDVRYEVGSGEIANILIEDFAHFSENIFANNSKSEYNQAVSLLLVASALRPALLAPNTGASQILSYLRLGEGLNKLYEYCQVIARHGDQRLVLDTKAIKTVKSQEEWVKEITLLRQDVDCWLSQASTLPLKSPQARRIWRKWLESDGFIYELLLPIKNNSSIKLSEVQVIQDKLKRLYQRDEIDRIIESTKVSLNGNKKREIDKDDYTKLDRYVKQACDLCQAWIELQKFHLDKANDLTQRQTEKLKQNILNLYDAVWSELNDFIESRRTSVLLSAGISCCQKAVADIQNIFDAKAPLYHREHEPKHLVHADILKIPTLTLDEDWLPNIDEYDLLLQGILKVVADNTYDWRTAFEVQSQSRNHKATEQIIEYLRANPETLIALEELEKLRGDLVEQCQDSLQRSIKQTRNQIENAVALGILKEADRNYYVSLILDIEKDIKTNLRFDKSHDKLQSIESTIEKNKRLAIDNVKQRLNLLSLESENSNSTRIIQLLDKGDVLTANEYIDMLERGNTISGPEIDLDKFKDFFPEKVFELDNFMEKVTNLEVVQKIKYREGFCGIDLRRLPGSVTDRASEMLEVWFTIKKLRLIDSNKAQTILEHLGFKQPRVHIEQSGNNSTFKYTRIKLTTEIIRNKDLCPVTTYGSLASGQYRILCVWERPQVTDILNLVGETYHSSPTIVFFFGRLTEKIRRDLARICRESRRTFILIDDILMLYLCGAEEPRLPTLFKCALPFTFLEPYTTTAGLVPPEIFFGRKQERDSIINAISGSCSSFIYGGRQLGKTALLRSVEKDFHSPQEGKIAYWLDLKACGIGVHRPIENLWSEIATEFKKLQIIPRNMPDNAGADTIIQYIENWLKDNNNRRILLLLDEADKFLESDAISRRKINKAQGEFIQTTRLKGLMDRTERHFKVVFAGLHNVLRTTRAENHPLAHYGEPICIGPLLDNEEWREARNLIKQPLTSIGYVLSDDLVTRILSQTNYYPSLIQLYCQELLRDVNKNHLGKFGQKKTPPYEIAERQVDEAYQSQNLRKAIRDRFMWTLQLDQRYEVIAYSIAYESLTNSSGMVDGFSTKEIKDAVLNWWPEGFQGKFEDEIRALLEEMVGLGILREVKEVEEMIGLGISRETEICFALRSPNVVFLLGTEAEIEEQLLRNREAPIEYDPETFRSALRDNLSRRSPLTVQQESSLRKREYGVSIVFGCPAAGLNELKGFLLSSVGQEFFFNIDNVLEANIFARRLTDIDNRSKDVDGTTIVFVLPSCSWDLDWVETAFNKVKKLKSKKSFVRFVFAADPQIAWNLISQNSTKLDTLIREGVSIFSLKPWHDAALRQWLEDCNFTVKDEQARKQITEITGNWPILLERLCERDESNRNWKNNLQELANSLTNSEVLAELADLMGINCTHPERRKILNFLSNLEVCSTEDLIDYFDSIPNETINQTLRWAELLHLAYPVGNSNWRIDSLVGHILTSLEE